MTLTTPFLNIEGNWFVLVEWRPDEPLPKTLTLRGLKDREVRWLRPRLIDANADGWARMFRDDNAIQNGAGRLDME